MYRPDLLKQAVWHVYDVIRSGGANVARMRSYDQQRGRRDLETINRLITRAVMQWKLPERMKRLALQSYLYRPQDLAHLEIHAAETHRPITILDVAALEATSTTSLPASTTGLLLHGIHIDPMCQRSGIGKALVRHAMALIEEHRFPGLLVSAQPNAVCFFSRPGTTEHPVTVTTRDSAHRFRLAAGG